MSGDFIIWGMYAVILAGFPGGSKGKASICLQSERPGFGPGVGRPPGGGHGNPLQYSRLENAMDKGTGYSPWGCKESDTTEWLSKHSTCGSDTWRRDARDAVKHSTSAQDSFLQQRIIWPRTSIVMMGEKPWPRTIKWKVMWRTIPYPMPSFPMGCKALTTKYMPSTQGTGRIFPGEAYPPERKNEWYYNKDFKRQKRILRWN